MSDSKVPTTIISSKSHRVRIAPNRRTVVIGERCNALGYKKVRDTVARGEWEEVVNRAVAQFEAGAGVININMVGLDIPEKVLLPIAVTAIRSRVDCPLSIDFGDPAALDAALAKAEGRCLINSISGEQEKMDEIFPIAKKHGAAMVAMTADDDGIPYTAEGRLNCALKILEEGKKYGFGIEDFIFDCIAIGVATDVGAGRCTMDTMKLIREKLNANITLGASNVSFGMPKRKTLDAYYLAIAITYGLNAPITDITHPALKWSILTADTVNGTDKLGMKFIRESRLEKAAANATVSSK
ncbi:Pterin binding enzyme domain protein [Verrucomicrobiia bacterium DG1235]|nr:Pterin binding enzyme domain protein [Verrucomicrobiae bacterium DG1235]